MKNFLIKGARGFVAPGLIDHAGATMGQYRNFTKDEMKTRAEGEPWDAGRKFGTKIVPA